MSANTVWQRLLSFFPEVLKGNSGAAPAVDWTAGSVQSLTLNAATVTPTFVAPPGGANLALVLTQDGVGGRAVTWPAAVSWIGGTAPILLSGAAQTTLVYFYFDGTTYWGSLASGASPASIIPWTAVAAGTALAASLAKPNLAADSSGAQSTITLPTAAAMASSDGYEFTIKATGNMVSPVIVTAGAGATIELLNAPGTFGASTWLPIQGQGVVFKYDLGTTTWKVRASSEGSGAPGMPAYNPGWYARTTVQWDPGNASGTALDSNTGAAGSALLTWGEIVRRYGATDPQFNYAQICTYTMASAQPAGADPVFFTPKLSGGGQAVLDCSSGLVANGVPFSPATVTLKNQATGQVTQLNTVPAGVVAKNLLKNVTQNSWAFVDAVVAGPNAKMTQPLTNALLTTPGNPTLAIAANWLNTDSYQAYTLPLLNLKAWRPIGSDAGAAVGTGWVQFAQIADSSGAGGSITALVGDCGTNVLASCQLPGRLQVTELAGRSGGAFVLGCDVTGQIALFSGSPIVFGGTARGALISGAGAATIDGGLLMHGACTVNASLINGGDVFADGSLTIQGGGAYRLSAALAGTAAFWGSAAVTVNAMSSFQRATGASFAATLLTSGALKLGANATGSGYVGGGVFTDGIAITAASIDTGAAGGAGLSNPVNGGRFCNAT
jgi:hypothetical protein